MSVSKAITVRLDPVDYERLEAEAKRQGMYTGALARVFVRGSLNEIETADERKRRGLEALERLAQLTADLPPVDAVQIARESREELEQRLVL